MLASLAYEAGLRADLPFAVSVAERMILKGLGGMVSAYLRVDGMTRERAIEELYPGVCDLFWLRRRLEAAEGLGDWDRALRAADLLHSVVRGTDEEPAAARRLAVALAHAGRIQDAHALVTGNGANDLVTRSEIERAAHRLEPALALAQSAVAAAPDAAAPHAQQGRILLQLRRLEEAKTSFQRAVALDARCAGALRGLGWLSLTVDSARADAEDFFARAIALEPASGDARIGRYLACAARGIEARAAADFRISFGVTHADSLSDPRPPREKLATTMTLVGQDTRAIE
jgi:tetratricopeptide (TPR) repeat protein